MLKGNITSPREEGRRYRLGSCSLCVSAGAPRGSCGGSLTRGLMTQLSPYQWPSNARETAAADPGRNQHSLSSARKRDENVRELTRFPSLQGRSERLHVTAPDFRSATGTNLYQRLTTFLISTPDLSRQSTTTKDPPQPLRGNMEELPAKSALRPFPTHRVSPGIAVDIS